MNQHEAYLKVASGLPTDPHIKRRLDRAWDMITGHGYRFVHVPHEDDPFWQVIKASTSAVDTTETVYEVRQRECTCPDFDTARAGLCKHRLAVAMLRLIDK